MTEPLFAYEPRNLKGFEALTELALDLRWSWDHGADDIWRSLDPVLWELTRNPWVILQTVAPEKIEKLNADANFHARVQALAQERREGRTTPAWFQTAHAGSALSAVAYFSMEFMLGEALPIYSGGLGNVAGDQLKAASDLGVPIVGVGLLYQQGYFRQAIRADGSQEALYPFNDPGQLPIAPARDADGEWIRLEVQLPSAKVWLRAWQVQIGRVNLYLLDTNDPANPPAVRSITSQLYGGGPELRLTQEMVLGIGGWRLLGALRLNPEVCHLNEGHAAFAVLERAAAFMQTTLLEFDAALSVTRAGNLFTTHTPVAAGFDRFSPDLMRQYLGAYADKYLGLSFRDFMALGRQNPDDENEPFNMAYLAVRGCAAVNGVSRLHGQVSREIFQPLFPRWPRTEVPVGSVTNGIHVPTWDSSASDALWTKYCGKERWLGATDWLNGEMSGATDAELWAMRQASRIALVEYAREQHARQLSWTEPLSTDSQRLGGVLELDALTLGFARRFATYKRPTLLLHDPERLARILTDTAHPVQLIIAGKAHPADLAGQEMIRQWIQFTRREDVYGRVIFLSDYDMFLTEQLVAGVDVWINTPRRPWEACGTSGMKVLANGGINLSSLDGWWAEAYTPEIGWALGDGQEHGDDPAWDARDAETLYSTLENEILPQFYARDANGIPTQWLAKMRQSMSELTPRFSANRAVRQYAQELYLPAADRYCARAADNGVLGARIAAWRRMLAAGWGSMEFGEMQVGTRDGQHHFEVQVDFGGIPPDGVSVELYAEPQGSEAASVPMVRGDRLINSESGYAYSAAVPATRPASDFTPRIIPRIEGLAVPLEAPMILWQR